MSTTDLWIFFPIAITLHNLEEALWLPRWSQQYAKKFHKPVESNEFIFAVLVITVLAYLSTFLASAFPAIWLWKQIFHGFLGAMILNTISPHLIATIVLRKYCPGLLTGIFLLVPVNATILYRTVTTGSAAWTEVLLSTLVVGAVLLGLIPMLFKLGKKIPSI